MCQSLHAQTSTNKRRKCLVMRLNRLPSWHVEKVPSDHLAWSRLGAVHTYAVHQFSHRFTDLHPRLSWTGRARDLTDETSVFVSDCPTSTGGTARRPDTFQHFGASSALPSKYDLVDIMPDILALPMRHLKPRSFLAHAASRFPSFTSFSAFIVPWSACL